MPGIGTSGANQMDTLRAMPRAGRTLSRPGRTLLAMNRNLWGYGIGHCPDNECPGLGGLCPGLGGHYLPGTGTSGAIQLDTVRAMPRAGRTLSRPGRTLFARNTNLCQLSNWTLSEKCPGWEDTFALEQEPLGLSSWTLSGQCPGL